MQSWPHAPSKVVTAPGMYIITSGTHHKQPFFDTPERLELLNDALLTTCAEERWEPYAWAVFANHYHLVAATPKVKNPVQRFTSSLHSRTARELNQQDDTPGRSVWYRCWDTRIEFEKSLLARMSYVHFNPVKHGVATLPEDYPYCSARWFIQNGDRSFVQTVLSFKTDKVNVHDDF